MNEAAVTLDGWYALHDLRTMDWASWKTLSNEERQTIVDEFQRFSWKTSKST